MKYITIFFDFEGKWGMPFRAPYNLKKTTANLLKVLKKYQAKAVFNTCGIIADKHPDIIKEIQNEDHEIAVHGYEHENFSTLNSIDMATILGKSEKAINKIIGKNPIGFRAPYLYDPIYYNKKLYKVLRTRGYKWVSNRQITRIEEIVKISGIPKLLSTALLPLINLSMVLRDSLTNRTVNSLRNILWLFGGKKSFNRSGIIEIPLVSTMDCFLFGLPKPDSNSSIAQVNKFINILKSHFDQSGDEFNLNFHDWIIGTSNRIIVLDEILKYVKSKKKITIVTASQLINLK
ncbi:polysaccharide deacetylase family protein [Patescibacteria group bacterium]|nr:polysaccharide deacetylase family protein [Patescibacteria group bacterium]